MRLAVHKVLYVGDPHIRPDCLEEGRKLIDYICWVASNNGAEYICLLGDQFHTHSVIHLSVLGFWRDAFAKLADTAPTFVLVGNHDMSGKAGDPLHAMMLFDDVSIIASPTNAPWGALLLPYIADHGDFARTVAENFKPKQRTLVCHQTFDGSQYENGFYAKDGIDPNLVPHDHVISGHVHTPQVVGKIRYPGSPRWQTVSDANAQRAIWLVTHAADGAILNTTTFDVSKVCRPIYAVDDREDSTSMVDLLKVIAGQQEADWIVDVYGSEAYVKSRAEQLENLGARVRQFPTTTRALRVRESDGLPVSFRKFLGAHAPRFGTPSERLLVLASERISWMRGAA